MTTVCDLRIDTQRLVQMVIHQTEATDGNSKDLNKFLQPILDSILTSRRSLLNPTHQFEDVDFDDKQGALDIRKSTR
jgi:hypothetical protein